MRTTIDLPGDLRRKLATEAMARGLKGYSKIIAEALCEYFQNGGDTHKHLIDQLRGCLSKEEYDQEMKRLKEGENNWRT